MALKINNSLSYEIRQVISVQEYNRLACPVVNGTTGR